MRFVLAAAVVFAGACARASPPVPTEVPAPASSVVASNVTRADYAGSAACQACHAEVYDAWKRSPMRRMTRHAEEVDPAPFDGRTFTFKDDVVVLEAHEGRRYVRVTTARHGMHLFRVTKVVGGRYREDYVGQETSGTDADSSVVGDPRDEPVLPVSYLLFDKSLRYKGYSVLLPERPRIERGAAWKQTCIFCHNTTPLLTTLYDDLYGKGAEGYQGSVSDQLLPASRLWSFAIRDDAGLEKAVSAEIERVRKFPPRTHGAHDVLGEAIATTRAGFDESHLLEVGIGCEACHGGSAEHVRHPQRKPSFLPVSPLLQQTFFGGEKEATRAAQINHVCARCHTVLFSRYPYTWEGGTRKKDPGGSTINSGEARDFLLGACSGQMRCTACHDPHAEDRPGALEALGTVAGNKVCLGCHQRYAGPEALAAHSHHAPDKDGSACIGCHMPRKNAGLAYRLTRYHRIGSPNDRVRVERDRPVECAICHADKTVGELVGTMEAWWPARFDRAALGKLYGPSLDVNAISATIERGKPHERITAAGILGERVAAGRARELVPLLTAEIPLVRFVARHAMEAIEKRPMTEVDLNKPPEAITEGASRWLDAAPSRGH